ncbi:DUF5317 domain-containing protein [Demequina mangrovi]|uniref:Uncharacterized protein n=1 Tax=Demequina mangrovi TaxID=1043493 RepID=A0A1H7AFN4_9MICO|nr:DUF5317 domain-containing protein [Demequina mangrovi]SEJ59805.1 hypothetical protein SAMN05421637_2377 [Demequina mangrovi]
MLVMTACLLALVSPLVALRWPAGIALRRWRAPWLVWGALATQIVIIDVPLPEAVAPPLHVATYLAVLAFLWVNREVRGALVVGAGALANGLTIALNGGVLPASRAAVEAAGIDPDHEFLNSAVLADPVLPWLGDVFAWPDPLPLANTFSVGDVLIVVGVALAAWTQTRPLRSPSAVVHDRVDA